MKKLYQLFIILLIVFSQPVFADGQWAPAVQLTVIEPLVEWNGGAIRIFPSTSTNPAGCSNTVVYDFIFDVGTHETRSATVSAIYLAFTANKNIRFYIDTDVCSPGNAPVVRGAQVVN